MSGRTGFPGPSGDDGRPLPLHPDELAGDAVSAQELGGALEAARALETAAAVPPIRAGSDFADRVMASLEHEPAPGAAGYLVPVRKRGLRGLAASVRQAWWFFERGSRPFAARTAALAYVLAVVIVGTSLTGLAAYGFAGAIGLLGPDRSPAPTQGLETPAPITEPPATLEVTPTPPHSIEPTESPDASELESEDPEGSGATAKPTATPRETEDDDEHGSLEPSKTPKPSETPRASGSPTPSGDDS